MKYIPTIGLEIHAELQTASKMFCACVNNPDEEKPNTNVCSICLGHPGTLPVLNHHAILQVLRVGTAVGGTPADFTEWDRKNYFYPDIPKGYQISQYAYPLISGGELAGVTLERIHLEEDTAQSTHDQHEKSLVNFNRAGVPLMELVTKPVIHDAETAVRFAKELQLLLRYLGAGKAQMEKGEMRVEANISGASEEDTRAGKFGTKTEVKNLNSFRAVEGSIMYEIERQIGLLQKGEKVVQETRGWRPVGRAGGGQDAGGETYSQRSKESAHDYRYFPDPDIPKMKISEIPEFAPSVLKTSLPELPWIKRNRYATDYGMTAKEVAVFVDSEILSTYFDTLALVLKQDPKKIRLAVNYMLTDYLGLLKKEFGEAEYMSHISKVSAVSFASLIELISGGTVNSRGAKEVLALMYAEGGVPQEIAEKNGLIQKNDAGELEKVIDGIISAHPAVVSEYKAGKVASLQFLIGQAMKVTKGSANPGMLKDMFVKKMS